MRQQRRNEVPWLLVMAGGLIYWGVALGVGFGALRGLEHRAPAVVRDAPCGERAYHADGRMFVPEDCITVRFVTDTPDLPRPVPEMRGRFGIMDAQGEWVPRRTRTDPAFSGPDPEVTRPAWRPTRHEHDMPYGRTSY